MVDELMLPSGSFNSEPNWEDIDNDENEEYSAFLRENQEPSLWKDGSASSDVHAYRLFYREELFSDGPLLIRLTIQPDNSGIAIIKISERVYIYDDPDDIPLGFTYRQASHSSKSIDALNVERFFKQLEKAKFWELPQLPFDIGADGETWHIEGTRAGKFHFVDRWSPGLKDFIEIGSVLAQICDLPEWERRILRHS